MQKHSHKKISISIVEDVTDYREVLTMAIASEPDLKVIGAYANVESFLRDLSKHQPDVVIMDIQLPGMSGIEGVWKVKELRPSTEVIMCTVFEDDEKIFQSLRAGACGYILKSTPIDEIIEAIHEVAHGGAPMTPKIARKVLSTFKTKTRNKEVETPDVLTDRENEILQILGEGRSYNLIADTLHISLGTVQSHVKNIYRKLQMHSKSEIIHWLARENRTF